MLVALVIVGVVAAGLVVALVATLARARRLEVAAAEGRQAEAAAAERADGAEEAAREADSSAQAAREGRSAAEQASEAAERRAAEAAAQAARAEQARAAALAELGAVRAAAAAAPEGDPAASGLWVLEALRTERRWRESVAPGAAGSPFDGHLDPVAVAVAVVVDAAREESGTSFELAWQVEGSVAPAEALVLGRVVDELLAVAAARTDGGELTVSGGPAELHVRLRTEPALVVPEELAAALAVLGLADEGPAGEGPAGEGPADEDADGGAGTFSITLRARRPTEP